MPRVRLLTFARIVSLGLCVSLALESPAMASPYAGSLRLVGLAPAGEVLGVPVPGQTPAPTEVNPVSQNPQVTGAPAPGVAPTGGPWMQPQVQVLVQPQIQVQAAPRGDASPHAEATSTIDTTSEASTPTTVATSSTSETTTPARVETSAVATNCPVPPAPNAAAPGEPTTHVAAPQPGSVMPELPAPQPSQSALKKSGQFRVAAGSMLLMWSSFAVGALVGMHHAKCQKGETKHCDRREGLMAIPVAGPLMTARSAGDLAPAHVVVGVLQGLGLTLILAGAVSLARERRLALGEDGLRVAKNTAIRAGSGLTLTTRF
jgi:hypothetical protein